jgi:integrase
MRWAALEGHRGVQVAHSPKCPAYVDATRRCRRDKPGVCTPHYRRRLYDPVTGRQPYSPSTTVLSEALGASLGARKGNAARVEAAAASRTLEDVALEWWPRFKKGRVPKRRGAGLPSETTINGYRPLLFKLKRGQAEPTTAPLDLEVRGLILAEFGHRPGDRIAEVEWQRWIDAMDVSRSRLDEILAVARGIYAHATRSTRAIWLCEDPTRNLQLPARDKSRRKAMRVAQVPEARELLAALPDDVALPYAMGFGTGLRRSEMARAEWGDVLWAANKILVRKSKSDAGELRRASLSRLAIQYLKAEFARQGFPTHGPILRRSVFSGKLADIAARAWEEANERRTAERRPLLQRITLQECRHTYASMLMAARYTSIEIMVNMGHSDLKATEQYLKALPQPNELNEADRLHNYEDGFAEAPDGSSGASTHGLIE